MTAIRAPGGRAPADSRRRDPGGRVRWRALARVTWRQKRLTFIGLLVIAAAVAAAVVVTGLHARHQYAAYLLQHCATSASMACQDVQPDLLEPARVSAGLHAAIVLAGMFLGAPLLARELESGASAFAWTQGITRTRWTAMMLAGTGIAVAAVSGAVAALASWWTEPFRTTLGISAWQAAQLDLTVPAYAAWMLMAVALGALAGVVLRRVVPAMMATLVVAAALLCLASWKLNTAITSIGPRVMRAPVIRYQAVAQGHPASGAGSLTRSWAVSWWYTSPGGRVFSAQALLNQASYPPAARYAAWLAARHYTFWIAYQPAGRYWLFAAAVAAVPAVLAAGFAVATIAVLRHRGR
jgi:hypothetical protein